MLCFAQKMKEASIVEEQKLREIRLGKVVPFFFEEINVPDVPGSHTLFADSMKRSKE